MEELYEWSWVAILIFKCLSYLRTLWEEENTLFIFVSSHSLHNSNYVLDTQHTDMNSNNWYRLEIKLDQSHNIHILTVKTRKSTQLKTILESKLISTLGWSLKFLYYFKCRGIQSKRVSMNQSNSRMFKFIIKLQVENFISTFFFFLNTLILPLC